MPPSWCAPLCAYAMTDVCMHECSPKRNGSRFELKKALRLEEMPPSPIKAWNSCMTPKERQMIAGAYMAKMIDHLHGRDRQIDNPPYWNQRTRPGSWLKE